MYKRLVQLENDFDYLVEERHKIGGRTYGDFAFLKNNTFQMMYEELADLVNYATFTYVKLRLFEEEVESALCTDRTAGDASGHQG
jgi:hypothetical protein